MPPPARIECGCCRATPPVAVRADNEEYLRQYAAMAANLDLYFLLAASVCSFAGNRLAYHAGNKPAARASRWPFLVAYLLGNGCWCDLSRLLPLDAALSRNRMDEKRYEWIAVTCLIISG